jgi:hypothetical protein
VSPITLDDLQVVGDLTFSTLKTRARDQLQDKGDAKGVRRAERIVNQALKYIASEKRWTWHRRLHTFVLRANIEYTDAVTMEPDSRTITLESGTWHVSAAARSFHFSGDTTVLRIFSRDSSTQLTSFSNEVYVGSAAQSAATGFLIYDRFALPENFRAMHGIPQEKDYYKDLFYISPHRWLDFRQSYQVTNTSPIYFTLVLNPATLRYEIYFWPTPSELREASVWIYVSPLELVNDNDIADWDPALSYALHAAIDLFVVKELGDAKRFPFYEKAYRDAVTRAKQQDQKWIPDEPASQDWPGRGNKIQRSPAALADE